MYDIFMKTLPFFALIGVGFWAGKTRFFTEEATAYLTKFVFYFALSAMLFKFSSNLSLGDLLNWDFIFAYLCATTLVYILATIVSLVRKKPMAEAAIEAQCCDRKRRILGHSDVGPVDGSRRGRACDDGVGG